MSSPDPGMCAMRRGLNERTVPRYVIRRNTEDAGWFSPRPEWLTFDGNKLPGRTKLGSARRPTCQAVCSGKLFDFPGTCIEIRAGRETSAAHYYREDLPRCAALL